MRYISRHCIQPDAILAKPILGPTGKVLLNEGVRMRPSYIRRLKDLGIPGAYVHDPLSEGVEVVSAISDELRMHAIRNISKTYSKAEAGKSVSQAAGDEMRKTAEQIVDEIINHGDVMLNLFDMKVYDSYTFFHCVNVTILAVVIGIGMDFNRRKLINLAYASLLHDIGKVFIDPAIINKPGRLTEDEYAIIKAHPQDGHDYVLDKFSQSITAASARGILEHHERPDGAGYPLQKAEGEISDLGKAIAIADVYDALISDRSYRKGVYPVEAMEHVLGNCGSQFDFAMASVFSQKVALFPVGTCVLLSNGATGLVTENFEGFTQRPTLKIFREDGVEVTPYMLSLKDEALDVTVVASVEL